MIGTITGGDLVAGRFRLAGARIREEIRVAVSRSALSVQIQSKANKLSGQVLKVRTGHLRQSINVAYQESTDSIGATVGTNVSYGALWELGFSRRVGAGARGGPTGLSPAGMASYFAKHPPGTRAYPPRSFLLSALNDMKPRIRQEFAAAVARSLK